MGIQLKGRHLLTLADFSSEEIAYLLDLSAELKKKKREGVFDKRLKHLNIALIFEKPSTRTRCAFVVACVDEGAHPEYLGKGDIQLGKKETVADTARVLGRMFDGIEFRGFKHSFVEDLARYAGVPVWNGLTDRFHPTQILADLLTVRENFGRLRNIGLAFVGDGRNNMANSLLIGGAKMGMDVRIVAPSSLHPAQDIADLARKFAGESGARIDITSDVDRGVSGAHVIYTDVWASMGEEAEIPKRIELLKPYRIDAGLMAKTNIDETIFLHCLPAFHNLETDVAQQYPDIREVSDEVFEGPASRVFDQAENRMHTIKAVMVATLNPPA